MEIDDILVCIKRPFVDAMKISETSWINKDLQWHLKKNLLSKSSISSKKNYGNFSLFFILRKITVIILVKIAVYSCVNSHWNQNCHLKVWYAWITIDCLFGLHLIGQGHWIWFTVIIDGLTLILIKKIIFLLSYPMIQWRYFQKKNMRNILDCIFEMYFVLVCFL